MRWLFALLLVSMATLSTELQAYHATRHLSNSATSDQHPEGGLFHAVTERRVTAVLVGTSDFDLYLYTYKDGEWTRVVFANDEGWNEILSYRVPDDTWYAWFVVLKSPNTEGGDYFLMAD